MPVLFALTIFVSATLLFIVEPMVAKMVLPSLGGTPAVWNTCMVFYQAILLAGYAYAHALTSRLTPRRQVLTHVIVACVALVAMPIGILSWNPPEGGNPIPWLLALLTVSVGLPFFVLSASAPLLQKWFGYTGHPSARDPYFLYAASNLGSMIALLGYPVIIERFLPLKPERLVSQSWLWSLGYVLLILLVGLCGRAVWAATTAAAKGKAVPRTLVEKEADTPAPTWRKRLHWILLAFVPSSFMLGVTTHITTDIASIPLLWVIPLAIYLLSFILVFARWPEWAHKGMVLAMPLVVLLVLFMEESNIKPRVVLVIGLHLLALFLISMVCHGELARSRPGTRYLTEFFLLMSLGGVLGGLFNALVAPVIFKRVVEYDIALVLACMMLPAIGPDLISRWAEKVTGPRLAGPMNVAADVALACMLGVVTLALGSFVSNDGGQIGILQHLFEWLRNGIHILSKRLNIMPVRLWAVFMYGIPVVLCYGFLSRPLRFGLGVAAIMLAVELDTERVQDILYRDRSFFGVLVVKDFPGDDAHELIHGTTLHGRQKLQPPEERRKAITYYDISGPVGQVFTAYSGPHAKKRMAVIGLGTATLAAYRDKGESVTFYEIDNAVVRISQNPDYFTYYTDAQARGVNVNLALGDARLRLREASEAEGEKYDLIFVDAFSSDAIPVHLLTREAMQLYFKKLATDGVLVVHISNRHLNLEPVLGNLVEDLRKQELPGLVGYKQYDTDAGKERGRPEKTASDWVVLAREEKYLQPLLLPEARQTWDRILLLTSDQWPVSGLAEIPPFRYMRYNTPGWDELKTDPAVGVWTDDFHSLLSIFDWKN